MYNVELDCIWIWKLIETYLEKKLKFLKKHNLSQQKHGIILEHFGFMEMLLHIEFCVCSFILTWCQLTLVDWTTTWDFFSLTWNNNNNNGKKKH